MLAMFDYGYDQRVLSGYGYADIEVLLDVQDVVFKRGVNPWEVLRGEDNGLGDERQEGHSHAVKGLDLVDMLTAPGDEFGHVALIEGSHVRNGESGLDHVFGNDFSDAGHGDSFLEFLIGKDEVRFLLIDGVPHVDVLDDVVLGNAVVAAGAVYLSEIDEMFSGQAPHDG